MCAMRQPAVQALMANRIRISNPAQAKIPARLRLSIRRRLLHWYDQHKRDLPWRRRAGDPYAQWVAEIMLQQTRVDTVIPFYERFMRRFPDVESLARAREQTVLKLWEGLGYYRRIHHFHRAARLLRDRREPVPTCAADLQSLPGVGEYTAAAIASIAFHEPVAAVDGNVARVIARLFGVHDDVLSARGRKKIECLAGELLAPSRPGDFNQAWMDLGSRVCTPRSPDCGRCPLRKTCVAFDTDCADSLPIRGLNGAKRPRELRMVVGILVDGKRMLVRRRPLGGLWSGLWEFPSEEITTQRAAPRRLRDAMKQYGVSPIGRLRSTDIVTHQLTHRSITFHVYVADVLPAKPVEAKKNAMRWVTVDGFAKLSVSRAHRKIFETVHRCATAL